MLSSILKLKKQTNKQAKNKQKKKTSLSKLFDILERVCFNL